MNDLGEICAACCNREMVLVRQDSCYLITASSAARSFGIEELVNVPEDESLKQSLRGRGLRNYG